MSSPLQPSPTAADAANLSQPRPVFIVGAGRSGTTLLQQMLDHHPNLAFPWESHFLPIVHGCLKSFGDLNVYENRVRLMRDINHYVQVSWRERQNEEWIEGLEAAIPELAKDAAPSYPGVVDAIFSFFARKRNKARWGDKTPGYITCVPLILELFPQAKVLHIIRDGRDVVSSILPLSFGPNTAYLAARRWKHLIERGLECAQKWPERVMTLHYETLIDDPEKQLRQICDFIGEEFHPDMLNYHKDSSKRVPRHTIHANVAKPVNKSRCGRWKKDLSPRQARIVEAIIAPQLAKLGYEVANPNAKLRPMDRTLGRLGHRLLFCRPFTKPHGLIARCRMHFDRAMFGWRHS